MIVRIAQKNEGLWAHTGMGLWALKQGKRDLILSKYFFFFGRAVYAVVHLLKNRVAHFQVKHVTFINTVSDNLFVEFVESFDMVFGALGGILLGRTGGH